MLSYLPDVAVASQTSQSPDAGTPAGPIVVRVCDLLVRGGKTVTAGNVVPSAGELAVFCRPVVTAPALPRRDDEESFTAARHHAIRSMASSQVTASSSLTAIGAAADAAARAALHVLNVPARQRHSQRAQKARPKFAHTSATKQTVTGKPEVTVFAPGSS